MIAESVKKAFPEAKFVSVDVQTIRFTDGSKNLRYTYLTPRVAQIAIIQFDRGEMPDPFSVRLTGGHVTRANLKSRKKAGDVREGSPAQKEAWAKAAATARAALASDPPAGDGKGKEDPLKKSDLRQTNNTDLPERVGGRTPPLVPGGRRRQFGLRAFDRAQ
jgi:hypothetical protein